MRGQHWTAVRGRYEEQLRNQIMPFWLRHGVDREHGGLFAGLDRRGDVIDTDKSVWFQGRFVWLLASLYTQLEPRDEWLDVARNGIDFVERTCFDGDGRMFFRVDRQGRPLVKRRRYLDRARDLFALVERYTTTPGLLEPKFDQSIRPGRGFALPMILIAVLQEVRRADPGRAEEYSRKIDAQIAELRLFVKPEHEAVFEQVGTDGELQDHFEGRLLNPGHAIEGAWFIMKEAAYRTGAPELVSLATTMLDWMWKWGWDEQHSGIIYYRDVLNRPATEYWHDMKFWWPQCEAMIASLWAYALTGDERYARMHEQCDEWAHAHFPDPVHGEWFGYLHRDGSLSSDVKGTMFKGPFHVPRMYLESILVIDDRLGSLAGR